MLCGLFVAFACTTFRCEDRIGEICTRKLLTMVSMTEASAAVSSIKVALDIAKGAVGLKSATDINLAVIDIQRALLDAQSAAFDDRARQAGLQRQINELEEQLRQVSQWELEKSRYKLTESETGKLVYTLIPEQSNNEPDHHLCVTCFNLNRKSVLQVVNRHSGGESVSCHHCKEKITLKAFPKPTVDYGRLLG